MNDTKSPPSISRIAFGIHAIVAFVTGVLLLFIPDTFGSWVGYIAPCPEMTSVLRVFGAVLLGLGAVTSMYGVRAPTWARVDYIVRAEITTTALMAIVYIVSAAIGSGPLLSNALFGAVAVILFLLFLATWSARPK